MLTITGIKELRAGCYKLASDHGAFFIRTDYLPDHIVQAIQEITDFSLGGIVFDEADAEMLLESAEIFIVEQKAMQYLARQEHSRFLLLQKLVKKGFKSAHIQKSLDYLESSGALSDARYAEAFLYSRSVQKSEGRTKLFAVLSSKGIGGEIAKETLANFFENNPEKALLEKAAQKYARISLKCTLEEYLLKNGFSYKAVKEFLSKEFLSAEIPN